MPHPPCSPHLAPKWLFFVVFPMKKVLKEKSFPYVPGMKQKMAEVLKGIKINEFKYVLSNEKTSQ